MQIMTLRRQHVFKGCHFVLFKAPKLATFAKVKSNTKLFVATLEKAHRMPTAAFALAPKGEKLWRKGFKVSWKCFATT